MSHIFESANVAVRSLPSGRRDRWVVTFDNHGIGHGFDRPGFGQEFLAAEGISALHVMGRREDWYQYAEMSQAMAAVRAATAGADRVLTYGSSMGGYAAIRFADAAGAHAVLALSPQYSIDPDKAPFEQRWPRDSRRIRWLPEIDGPIVCAVAPVVVYDPASDDGRHAALIRNDIAVREIAVRNIGHPAATVLGELGLLKPLVLDSLHGAVDCRACVDAVRARRRESSVYVSLLAEAQPAHRPRTAIALARRGLDICPVSAISMATLGHLLTKAGEHEEAVDRLRTADLYCAHENLHVATRLTVALAASGRVEEAHGVARRIAAVHPHLVRLEVLERRILRVSDPRLAASPWRLRVEAAKVGLRRRLSSVGRSLAGR